MVTSRIVEPAMRVNALFQIALACPRIDRTRTDPSAIFGSRSGPLAAARTGRH